MSQKAGDRRKVDSLEPENSRTPSSRPATTEGESPEAMDIVDLASCDSFPASDPPPGPSQISPQQDPEY
jgi:hypothetical protein